MTIDEANAILNRFMGWEPDCKACVPCKGEHKESRGWVHFCREHNHEMPHTIPPFDYFANTPEARERVRLLEDEFIQRTGKMFRHDHWYDELEGQRHHAWIIGDPLVPAPALEFQHTESHAIAFAIVAALEENRK